MNRLSWNIGKWYNRSVRCAHNVEVRKGLISPSYTFQAQQIRCYGRPPRYDHNVNGFWPVFGKPTVFVVGGIGVSYTVAILLQEEKVQRARKQFPAYFDRAMSQLALGGIDWNAVWKRYEYLKHSQLKKKRSVIAKYRAKWLEIDDYYRCVGPIVFLNLVVFALWKVPRLQPMMRRFFLCTPRQSHYSSLCFSTFSHMNAWHVAGNMIALVSFGRFAYEVLGMEQFYAFYLSAGLCSSYVSYLAKFLLRRGLYASLGASGAVYAVMALVIKNYPEINVSLLLLPFLPLTGPLAFSLLVLFDLGGLFVKRSPLDHPAHLGGAAFGYFYEPLRNLLWNRYRTYLVTYYRKLRRS